MATAVVCAYSLVGRMALEALVDSGVDVLALYTYDQPGEDKWFEPPAEYAIGCGIAVHIEPDFNAEHVSNRIGQLRPDFLFSFYFRELIQPETLSIPKHGAYNLHGSLLPKYRGRAPINWVLVNGEAKTGVTLHAMTPRPDDGDIFGCREIPIDWDETALSLTKKTAEAGYGLLRERMPLLVKGQIQGIPQKTLGKSTYFGGRRPEDSRLAFEMTAREAFNHVRSVADPWPNATIAGRCGMVKVPWALPHQGECPQGHFLYTDEGVLLGFADAPIRLVELKHGHERSSDPRQHAEWLKSIGLPGEWL